MKTYLFDSLARFKRFSESLDVATTLSNKTWVVFNDSGERELYIFKPDGSVFITTNGVGYKGTWEWISANQSLIIQHDKVIYMLHPEIVEECVLVLTLDGTKDCVFLIEDQNLQSFAPKTLTQLQNHFEEKERKVIEAQKAETLRKINAQMRIEEERKRREAEKRKEMERARKEAQRLADDKAARKKREEIAKRELELKMRAVQIRSSIEDPWVILVIVELFGAHLLTIIAAQLFFEKYNNMPSYISIPSFCLIIILLITIIIMTIVTASKKWRNFRDKYMAEHPNDPVCKYLYK